MQFCEMQFCKKRSSSCATFQDQFNAGQLGAEDAKRHIESVCVSKGEIAGKTTN